MVTFNVDSLDFVDDEEIRTGANDDFATRFDSANSRLELEDLNAGTVGYIPQNISTDLVGGKFAETVAEGKALSDNGQVYDSIQAAVDNASSWVKVGPGDFRESVTIDTAGLTLEGSGNRTRIYSDSSRAVYVTANDVTVSSIKTETQETRSVQSDNPRTKFINIDATSFNDRPLVVLGADSIIANCTFTGGTHGIIVKGARSIITNNHVTNTDNFEGIFVSTGEDVIIAHNLVENAEAIGIILRNDDNIVIGNRVDNCRYGITPQGIDNIIANNRVSNSDDVGIDDQGTNTVLDANLVT